MIDTTRIDNKTKLNTSLETFLSSGAIDVIMLQEQSENNKPYVLNPVREGKVQIGDRYTVFLGELWTNNFMINLPYLGIHKTIFVNFQTTRHHSFSLRKEGNRKIKEYDVIWGKGTELWGKGTVENLSKYFDPSWDDNKLLDFTISIHKANSYTYEVNLISREIIDYTKAIYTVYYFPGVGKNTHVEIAEFGDNYSFAKLEDTEIRNSAITTVANWNTEEDGSGIEYEQEQQIVINDDIVVYAQWENKLQYILEYIIPNGTPNRVEVYTRYKSIYTLKSLEELGVVLPAQYEFGGWEHGGKIVTELLIEGDFVVRAVVGLKPINVTYIVPGGTPPISS